LLGEDQLSEPDLLRGLEKRQERQWDELRKYGRKGERQIVTSWNYTRQLDSAPHGATLSTGGLNTTELKAVARLNGLPTVGTRDVLQKTIFDFVEG
jgi:hypothetical protein